MAVTVGVIGLGNMGSAFAANLLDAGFAVRGYDVDEAMRHRLTERGGLAAASVRELSAEAEVVITSLPGAGPLLESVAGLAPSQGLPVVEMSTLALDTKLEARDIAARAGAVLLDSTVSGTGAQAVTRDLAVYASGDRTAYESAVPVLDAIARSHRYVGEFGTGTKLKFIANLLVSMHNVAAAEAVLLARKAGLDLGLVLDAITDGAGTSRMLEVRGPMMAEGRWREATASMSMFKKDLELIGDFAASVDCPLPLFASARQVYAAGMAQGRGDEDAAAVYAVLARAAALDVD